MSTGGTRSGVTRFRSARARDKFLRGYDAAFELWPRPFDRIDVETRYGSTRVHRYGPATGTPVVLLHGHGGNGSLWYPQVEALGARHPVYAIDAIDDPGGGVQRALLSTSEDYAAWLDEVLDGLGLDAVHLVGHSYGGWLSLNHASRRPQRVASVTGLDPAGIEDIPTRFLLHSGIGLLRLITRSRTTPRLARWTANAALIIDWRVFGPPMGCVFSFGPQRSKGRRYDDGELAAITAPALILIGGRSTLFRPARAAARIRELIPHARVETINRAGHGIPFEFPERVNASILAHLAGA
ncbi:alpha/beta fold hydrolase [Phytomonospora endophytica]|uniref:Pimeloyl-ACP methyl ester carboxylesterase n=1 Tax=Phytomonospora endophytica TaxID=714109 RepID=A0A841FIG4_9ACTN|nr:alpha/beta fold hydrolase [Phytomonospora endophytica]MBB6035996.1 pimeloyl-ACP methyl ester carboxylesterase [Phytomonospora endophytica]GIG66902.1 carboxylesterase [Phytomonospora endophytica]